MEPISTSGTLHEISWERHEEIVSDRWVENLQAAHDRLSPLAREGLRVVASLLPESGAIRLQRFNKGARQVKEHTTAHYL